MKKLGSKVLILIGPRFRREGTLPKDTVGRIRWQYASDSNWNKGARTLLSSLS